MMLSLWTVMMAGVHCMMMCMRSAACVVLTVYTPTADIGAG